MRSRKIYASSIILLSMFAVIFAFADFSLSKSNTVSDSQTDKFICGDPKSDFCDVLYLYVELDGDIDSDLIDGLVRGIENKGIDIRLLEELGDVDSQVMAIYLERNDFSYTPFYCSSSIDIVLGYSSDGNTEYFDDWSEYRSPEVSTVQGTVYYKCNIAIADKSKGLMSYKGYESILDSSIVNCVCSKLPKELI